ncbi:MAG: BON domain-containing protein [Bacteroidia bacterium]
MILDATIKQNVLDELDWEPSIDAAKVGVTVQDGIVTLSGHVSTYAEKRAAEKAAMRVFGVKAVVEEIDVKITGTYIHSDQDIAQMALNNLKWSTNVPHEKIKLKVEDGWIKLEGEVDWNYQRDAAKNCIKNLAGVKGVSNLIQVKVSVEPQNIKQKIKNAFERNASIDADRVNVNVEGHRVVLSGTVQSWSEKRQAEEATWSAPGVTQVVDNLKLNL